jgi:hypothetical protein
LEVSALKELFSIFKLGWNIDNKIISHFEPNYY